jgi:DNA-binding MarR family transcriptional regulator
MKRLSDSQLAAWRLFLTLHRRLVDAIDRDLQQAGRLSLSSYDVLIELQEAHNHRLRMAELANRVVLSRSGLTRLVDRLENEGYLARDQVSGDRRGAYAVITEQGIRALREAWPTYALGIQQYFAEALTTEEVETLAALLEKVASHFGAQGEPS